MAVVAEREANALLLEKRGGKASSFTGGLKHTRKARKKDYYGKVQSEEPNHRPNPERPGVFLIPPDLTVRRRPPTQIFGSLYSCQIAR